ncbi:MAG TPA: hypothetical protein VMB73_01770 [Acetobacteraceae bacterium]|nr:hypothetical protein [Acetobacteraceae bacterium]
MSSNEQGPDVAALLHEIAAKLRRSMPIEELLQIRDLLDDAAFLPQLKARLRQLDNSPEAKIALLNRLALTMRETERLRDRRESWRSLTGQMAVGGGTGIIIGGVVAFLNPAIGFLALIVAYRSGGRRAGGRGRMDDRSAAGRPAQRL